MADTDSEVPASMSTTTSNPKRQAIVITGVYKKIAKNTRRACAYGIVFVDSDIPPMVETYAQHIPSCRYCHLMAIRAVLRICSPDQEISIFSNYKHIKQIFETVNSRSRWTSSINLLRDNIQNMLDERTGSLQVDDAKKLVSESDHASLREVVLTACDDQISNGSLQPSKDRSPPQPTPYTLPESDISLRIQSTRNESKELTKKQKCKEYKKERFLNQRMKARKRKLRKEENEGSPRIPRFRRIAVTLRSCGTNPFLLNHQYEGHDSFAHDPSAQNKRIKLLDSSLDGKVDHSVDTVKEPPRPTTTYWQNSVT